MPNDFCHLHVHTKFSPLDGVASPEQYMEACAKARWNAIAFTDHGNMACVPDAYFASEELGIKYVAGCEVYLNMMQEAWLRAQQKQIKMSDLKKKGYSDKLLQRIRRNNHITILCKNQIGYRNLLAILRIAWSRGFYYKPRVWPNIISQHKDGLIILSGCLNSIVSYYIVEKQLALAKKTILDFKKMMGDDFYLEIQMPGDKVENSHSILQHTVELAKETNVKTVITNDVHYIDRKDHELQKILMAIDQNLMVDDPKLFYTNSDEQFLKTRLELFSTLAACRYDQDMSEDDLRKACDTTLEVAEKCQTFTPDRDPKLPAIPNADLLLLTRIKDELKNRKLWDCKDTFVVDGNAVTYKQQALLEYNRIREKGFSSYFLIMTKIVNYSTQKLNLPVGPARGSAGGSLVCYLLGIHSLDPMIWGLSFSRFLSPSRGGQMLKCTME